MARIYAGEFDLGSNTFFRPNFLEKAGDVIEGHAHNFDHVSMVVQGSVKISAKLPDGTGREVVKTASGAFQNRIVNIRAGVEHRITALEDGTEFLCIYSHRNAQGDPVQKGDGWEGALS